MVQARPLMFALGLIALVYGALAALAERDAKRVVAYSSLSHLGLILLAVFSGQPLAYAGAAVYIIAHGLFSAALFLALDAVEQREETRDLTPPGRSGRAQSQARRRADARRAGGARPAGPGRVRRRDPDPDRAVPRRLRLAGARSRCSPIVLAAGYMLRLFQGIMNGPEVPDLPERRDLTWLEGLAIAPLVLGFLWLGVNPSQVVALASGIGAPASRRAGGLHHQHPSGGIACRRLPLAIPSAPTTRRCCRRSSSRSCRC